MDTAALVKLTESISVIVMNGDISTGSSSSMKVATKSLFLNKGGLLIAENTIVASAG